MSDIIIFGAGGQAKMIADIAQKNGYTVKGFLDDDINKKEVLGISVLGKIEDCEEYKKTCSFAIGIGNNKVRREIFEKYADLTFPTLIHPSAYIGPKTVLGKGTVVMPLAVVNICAKVGEFSIINSGAVVEHDTVIGNFTHIAPNATVCGCCNIGNEVWLGAGSTVNQYTEICNGAFIGSAAAVVKDIKLKGTYIGVPAKLK